MYLLSACTGKGRPRSVVVVVGGAMERKATTHVGSWLSLSCVPSPAKQVLRLLIHSVYLHPQYDPVLENA